MHAKKRQHIHLQFLIKFLFVSFLIANDIVFFGKQGILEMIYVSKFSIMRIQYDLILRYLKSRGLYLYTYFHVVVVVEYLAVPALTGKNLYLSSFSSFFFFYKQIIPWNVMLLPMDVHI
jgi:hypothetical protein